MWQPFGNVFIMPFDQYIMQIYGEHGSSRYIKNKVDFLKKKGVFPHIFHVKICIVPCKR